MSWSWAIRDKAAGKMNWRFFEKNAYDDVVTTKMITKIKLDLYILESVSDLDILL
jgi:hypothetical protein